MDLKQLLTNHQRASTNASQACSDSDKATYFDLVAYYAKRIREHRDKLGLPRAVWPTTPEAPADDTLKSPDP